MYSYNHEIHPHRQTRKSHEIYIHKPKIEFTSVLPKYQFPRIWNNNTVNVQNQITLKMFAKQVKFDIVKSYTLNVNCANPLCLQCTGL